MKTTITAAVCCIVFLIGCWIARPARYQIAMADNSAPMRLDTRTGEVTPMVWDAATKSLQPAQSGAKAAQP